MFNTKLKSKADYKTPRFSSYLQTIQKVPISTTQISTDNMPCNPKSQKTS